MTDLWALDIANQWWNGSQTSSPQGLAYGGVIPEPGYTQSDLVDGNKILMCKPCALSLGFQHLTLVLLCL